MLTKNYKQTVINVLNEYLTAARICIKSSPEVGEGYTKQDVLGFPTATLLLCIIDIIDIVKSNSPEHFTILASKIFGDISISTKASKDLYEAYRNAFLHNGVLIEGRRISRGDGKGQPFIINAEDKVEEIELVSFLQRCELAIKNFESSTTEEEILKVPGINKHIEFRSINSSKTNISNKSSILGM